MTLLVRKDVDADLVSDVVDHLRHLRLDHYAALEKIRLIEQKANIDIKTNLYKYNENYLENILKIASRALEGSRDEHFQVAHIRLDIDNFSRMNNTYGHDLGDKVLQGLAGIIRDNTRPTDYPIRFGGEEFDLLLPSTDIKGAVRVVQKIFQRLRAFSITHQREKVKVTVSAGISLYTVPGQKLRAVDHRGAIRDYHKLQKESDDALYDAKASGKNQLKIYDPKKKRLYPGIRRQYALKNVH
jgi:diguanylate cyclase (GGDEF)-like protein